MIPYFNVYVILAYDSSPTINLFKRPLSCKITHPWSIGYPRGPILAMVKPEAMGK